jgi:hypothetical protein
MDATVRQCLVPVIDYIAAFDRAAVCRYADGRLGVTRNPAGTAAAWWCEAAKAGPVIRAARQRSSGDIPEAARVLGIALAEHATVLARAQAAVARIQGRHGTKERRAARVQSRVPSRDRAGRFLGQPSCNVAANSLSFICAKS